MSSSALYVIALYIRLSIEDYKVESMSIENQKSMLHHFVSCMEDAQNAEVLEYVDNGFSGTNFERPAVQKLLDDARTGKINCIIVKDFTRFGRNSIEVGYFMERVFPLYGIRFISVNDDFDSIRYQGDTGGIDVAFRYLVAEFYSRDLSIKIKSALHVKMQRGEYQSRICPYGYQKTVNGRIEPDPDTAPIVQLIFSLAQSGANYRAIARHLLQKSIPTPREYKVAKGIVNYDVSTIGGVWSNTTLRCILTDERYIGTYVIGKKAVTEIGSIHVRWKNESEWFKIPDHHPAIISRELFDQVQAMLPKMKRSQMPQYEFPLRGKVFCGCCRHAMNRPANRPRYFYCRHTEVDNNAPCHRMRISEAELESMLYQTLSNRAQIILGSEESAGTNLQDIEQAKLIDRQIADCYDKKRVLYEKLLLHDLSVEEYKEQKSAVSTELARLQQIQSSLQEQEQRMRADNETRESRRQAAQEVVSTAALTVQLANQLIDKVYVYPGNQVEIIWKVKDF